MTTLRSPERITARVGTTTASRDTTDLIFTFAYIPGFRSIPGLEKTIRTFTVRVFDSRKG